MLGSRNGACAHPSVRQLFQGRQRANSSGRGCRGSLNRPRRGACGEGERLQPGGGAEDAKSAPPEIVCGASSG